MNLEPTSVETKINRMKYRGGFAYGVVAGLALAITLWGLDGYLLSQAHAYFPWTKFIAGGALTVLIGGLAGWLVSRIEKALIGILIWFMAGGLFAWLTVLVPIVISPVIMGSLDPELQILLHYGGYGNQSQMVGVSFAWIAIAVFILATIQIPLIEQSVFSVNVLGKIVPYILASLLMLSSGAILDNLHNQPLRQPIQSLDQTIQFTLNNRDKEVDPKVARELHAAALRTVQDWLSPNRRLVIGQYDLLLENVNVLVNFDGVWVECETIFGHPLYCQPISP